MTASATTTPVPTFVAVTGRELAPSDRLDQARVLTLPSEVDRRLERFGEMEERLAAAIEAARHALSSQADDLRRRTARVEAVEERVTALSTWVVGQLRTREEALDGREADLDGREAVLAAREVAAARRRWFFGRG